MLFTKRKGIERRLTIYIFCYLLIAGFGLDDADPGLGSMNSTTKGRHQRLGSMEDDEWDASINPHDESPFEKVHDRSQ